MIPRQSPLAPELNEVTDKIGKILALDAQAGPIDPADLIVLAIGIVVALLAVADFVAGEQHRYALG